MIIEQYYPDPEGMAALYKRWRSPEGELIEETVTDFQPYTWVKADTPPRLLTRLSERYYGLTVDRSTKATGLYGEDLIRVNVMRPHDLRGVRREIDTWEADLRLPDRYLIDEVKVMPDWKPRVWHLDLEWDPVKKFTTVIAFSDSQTGEHVAYCWSERSAKELGVVYSMSTRMVIPPTSHTDESSVIPRRLSTHASLSILRRLTLTSLSLML